MQMKTIFRWALCALLTLCLLCSSSALAEKRALRISGSVYDTNYLDKLGITVSTPNYHWANDLPLLQLDNAPDLYNSGSDDCDLRALKDAGVLADLSGSEAIREAVSHMRPELQQLITDDAGRIVAMPMWFTATNPVYWRQEGWEAAGLTEADVPQSYTELLDFAEAWAERVQKHPEKDVCFTDTFYFGGNASYCYTWWLTDMLINTWEMQSYEAGEPLNFNTPEFIALLKRTREVGKLLRKAEPSQTKRHKMISLFWNLYGCSGFDGWFNGGREEGLVHTVPFRITRDQPALMRGLTELMMVRDASEYRQELIGYLEQFIPSTKAMFAVEIYQEGAKAGDFGTDFVEHLSEGWIKERNEYTGIVCFAPMRTFFQYEGSLMKFIKGELSAEKLAKKISVAKTDPNK